MKGDKKVIDCLNEVLAAELTAINQYFLHSRICKDWGYDHLDQKFREESIDEMRHAQELMDRILFLKGMPNVQKLDKVNIGESVPEMLSCDLKLELDAIPRLKEGIKISEAAGDFISRELLEKILKSEEEHVDWIESQQTIIKDAGVENYLAEQFKAGK
jgi:bacterioferritin